MACCVMLCYVVLCCVVLSGIGFCLFDFCSLDHIMVTYVPCATMTLGGGGWHGTQCNGSCTRVIGTCLTSVTSAGRATMTWRGGGAAESVLWHVP